MAKDLKQPRKFDEVLTKFKANNKRNYDFLMKASDDFKDSVFLLCKRIIESESVPKKFRESMLHQIWKRKPGTRKEDLEANRYIHCKEWLLRMVKAMVVKEMETVTFEATPTWGTRRSWWSSSTAIWEGGRRKSGTRRTGAAVQQHSLSAVAAG